MTDPTEHIAVDADLVQSAYGVAATELGGQAALAVLLLFALGRWTGGLLRRQGEEASAREAKQAALIEAAALRHETATQQQVAALRDGLVRVEVAVREGDANNTSAIAVLQGSVDGLLRGQDQQDAEIVGLRVAVHGHDHRLVALESAGESGVRRRAGGGRA